MKNALVISGGTARGAYAAGLVEGLFTRFPALTEHVHLLSGTSTGSLIAPMLGLYCLDRDKHAGALELIVKRYQVPSSEAFVDEPRKLLWRALRWIIARLWKDEVARSVTMLGETGAVLDASPLRKTVEREYTDALLGELFAARDRLQVYVNCVSAQTGSLVAFSSADPAMTPARFRDAIFASCMQPVFMPLVQMQEEGETHDYMDGGVRDVVPADSAFWGGATRLLAIALFHEKDGTSVQDGSFAGRKNIARLVGRVVLGLLDQEVQDDDVLQARLLTTVGKLVRHARERGASDETVRELLAHLTEAERARFTGDRVLHSLYVHRPASDVPLEEQFRWTADGMTKSIDAGRRAARGEEGERMRDFLTAPEAKKS